MKRIVALIGIISLMSWTAPAQAATLTGATFTTSGTGYTVTNARNTRYDWGFTTTTPNTLSKVTMSTPSGTRGLDPYVWMPGTNGNRIETSAAAGSLLTGDLDVRVRLRPDSWTGSIKVLASRDTGGMTFQASIDASGYPTLERSANGSTVVTRVASTPLTFTNGETGWVRYVLDADAGATNHKVRFYTSANGTTWTQLGTEHVTAGIATLFASSSALRVGANNSGFGLFSGRVYHAEIRNSADTGDETTDCRNAAATYCMDPRDHVSGGAWTSPSVGAESWSIFTNSNPVPTAVRADLSVVTNSGLPYSTAVLTQNTNSVTYSFAPTSVAASTPVTIGLAGFVNTPTAGNYTSIIRTYDNAITPVIVDNATTAALSFTVAGGTATVSATVSPSFTFSVSGQSAGASCNGATHSAGATSTGTDVSFGRLNVGSATVTQGLSVSSNSANGWIAYIKSSGPLSDGRGNVIDDVAAGSPAAFPSSATEAFGYTSSGLMSVNTWARVTTSNVAMSSWGAPRINADWCVAYQAQTTAETPAGLYSTTVTYTAVPTF